MEMDGGTIAGKEGKSIYVGLGTRINLVSEYKVKMHEVGPASSDTPGYMSYSTLVQCQPSLST